MGIKYEMKERPVTPKTAKIRTVVGYKCDGCGSETDDQWSDWEWMIPITVEAGERGEEGNQIVERVYCDECSPAILDALVALGFSTHYHGSTNFLEDPCLGEGVYEDCPQLQHDRYGNIDPEAEAERAD